MEIPRIRAPSTPTTIQPVAKVRPVAPVQRDLQQVIAAVADELRAYLRAIERDLELHVDVPTGTTVISVLDATTGELIRQIPTEEAMRIRHRMDEGSGTLLDRLA